MDHQRLENFHGREDPQHRPERRLAQPPGRDDLQRLQPGNHPGAQGRPHLRDQPRQGVLGQTAPGRHHPQSACAAGIVLP